MRAPDAFSIGVARAVWKCRSDMNTMLAVYGREGAARPGRSKACDLDGRQLRKKSNRSALGNDLRRGCRGAPSLLRSGGTALCLASPRDVVAGRRHWLLHGAIRVK